MLLLKMEKKKYLKPKIEKTNIKLFINVIGGATSNICEVFDCTTI